MRARFVGRGAWVAAFASLALACSSADDGAVGATADLIGGTSANVDDLPSTFDIAAGCTAAKIAPKVLLTAGHCVVNLSTMDPKYGPGKPVGLARDPSQGHVDHTVARVHIHPDWAKKCGDTLCSIAAVAAKVDAPDVGLIVLDEDLHGVPITPVETRPLAPGDDVILVGFGCTKGVHLADDRPMPAGALQGRLLRTAQEKVAPPSAALHDGSPVVAADVPVFSGNYALTLGPGSGAEHAGLCPGDSGGPLYARRAGALAVVGVNANYTLKPDDRDEAGLPVTNWHTRLDDESHDKVGVWIRSVVH